MVTIIKTQVHKRLSISKVLPKFDETFPLEVKFASFLCRSRKKFLNNEKGQDDTNEEQNDRREAIRVLAMPTVIRKEYH